jgi:hypothetical protein
VRGATVLVAEIKLPSCLAMEPIQRLSSNHCGDRPRRAASAPRLDPEPCADGDSVVGGDEEMLS